MKRAHLEGICFFFSMQGTQSKEALYLEWKAAESDDLIEQDTEGPHVTHVGEEAVLYALR